jgi:16S rRNA (cytidine1402-2'-O)-methyltransferase
MSNKGKLFLIPNAISDTAIDAIVTPHVREYLPGIRIFLAEDLRSARRFLSRLKIYSSIESLSFSVLNKDSTQAELPELMKPLLDGENIGVISESGCPGIADPGALAVDYAHKHGIQVVPLVGPSSILLALMASGLNGQNFAFNGYLPIDKSEIVKAIRNFEGESRKKNQTQIFIETPYRNNQTLQALVSNLSVETFLTVAIDLTGATELIQTRKVKDWSANTPSLPKSPAVFLFLA